MQASGMVAACKTLPPSRGCGPKSEVLCQNAGMTTLLAALIGGGLAIAGGLVGVFATDRRERSRWRRDAQLKVGTELLSSLQEVIRRMIHLAYLTEKPPQPTLTPAASTYHEASVKWNSSIYAALLVSTPKIADMVQDMDREVDRLGRSGWRAHEMS